jgi:hypothetical protein
VPSPGAEVDADTDAEPEAGDAEAGPRHYQPGALPSCLTDVIVIDELEPADAGSLDEPVDAGAPDDASPDDASPDAAAFDDAATNDASTDDVSTDDASTDDVSTDDASPDDVSVDAPAPDDASLDDASVDEPPASDDAGDETATAAADLVEPGDPGPADLNFTIRADRGVHPISPLIYGTNDRTNFAGNGMGLLRSGGNRWTAFNWENGASNAGKDFKYQNDDNLSTSDVPGLGVLPTIQTALAGGAVPLVTVPIVSYVAADKNAGGDVRTTPDYLATRFKENMPTKLAPFSRMPDPADSYVYQDEFVSWAKAFAVGGQVAFSLDNEPDLWSSTHPEVHPQKVTYDELVSRNIDFALAIKNVWPEAKVFGFVSFGWSGYTTLQGAPDADEKGDFVEYYLDKMLEAECFYQKRLVDYLDLHWYSEIRAGGARITSLSNNELVVKGRLDAPRSLWDPTFVEDTYITNPKGTLGAVPITLIPRMLDKIRRHYPGTGLSISEWTYGGGNDISGALATADALGIFGAQGLGASANWPLNAGPYTWAAYRAFRAFDGKGAHFGDTSIEAVTSDTSASSVFASIDSSNPDRVVVVAINKMAAPKSAAIRIAHEAVFSTATVYTLSAAGGPTLVPAPSIASSAANAFTYTMPARSLSVLVMTP